LLLTQNCGGGAAAENSDAEFFLVMQAPVFVPGVLLLNRLLQSETGCDGAHGPVAAVVAEHINVQLLM
jgi:hypothetical protein